MAKNKKNRSENKTAKEKSTIIFDPPHIPDQSTLRPYQKECIDAIENAGAGSYLCVLATGLGKTFIFSHLPRRGRVLILSHREELVHQPEKYFDCSFGIEQGKEHSNGEEVVSASVQTLVRRLDKFDPYDFDTIITDEAHHATANSYRKIYDYFKPRVHLGFTATPDRADKADLNKIFDDIIYTKDIKWAIKNGFLTDIDCIQVDVGFDLRKVHKQMGDFKVNELCDAINRPEVVEAVADAYHQYAKGQTLIFAANVAHANSIADHIPNSIVVTGDTPNRAEIIERFTNREIPCLVNCMVFTEGTDIPLIETVIMARPTNNQSLYNQAVGRGLRLYPGKETLTLIDCVGVTGRLDICTAPTLFGLGTDLVKDKTKLRGKLTEIGELIEVLTDTPVSWIRGAKKVNLFAEDENFDLNDLNFILMPDQSLRLSIGDGISITIPQTDARGITSAVIKKGNAVLHQHQPADIQTNINHVKEYLETYHAAARPLWSKKNSWSNQFASIKQIQFIKNLAEQAGREIDDSMLNISKQEASIIIERLKYEIAKKRKNAC
jgi:superfamily II DNA or RNA helicase